MDGFFFSIIAQATLVAQFILLLLALMSVASWAIIIQKWISFSRARKKAAEGIDRFRRARDLRDAVMSLGGEQTSPLYAIASEGVNEYNRLKEMGNSGSIVTDNVQRSLGQGVQTEIARLQRGLPFLATAANTAPFIGLFGTVWGIMTSFHAIGQLKSASLAAVAPGISEALIATAIGLAVAIPASIAYNAFQGVMGGIEVQLSNFAGLFLNRVEREADATARRRAQAQSAGNQ